MQPLNMQFSPRPAASTKQTPVSRRWAPVMGIGASLMMLAAVHAAAPAAAPAPEPKAKPAKAPAKSKAAPPKLELPAEILNPSVWNVVPGRNGTIETSRIGNHPVMTVAGLPVTVASNEA